MKIIIKTLLLTIILIFFPLKSFAHVEHYEKVEKFLMEIFKDGRKINRDRVFACIERYIGRLPIKDRTPYSTPPVWSAVST